MVDEVRPLVADLCSIHCFNTDALLAERISSMCKNPDPLIHRDYIIITPPFPPVDII